MFVVSLIVVLDAILISHQRREAWDLFAVAAAVVAAAVALALSGARSLGSPDTLVD